VGIWTLVAASTVGNAGRVFSFEPNPMTFRKLISNVQRNGQTAIVTPFQQAVSSANGTVFFSCAPHHNLSAIADDPKADHVVSVEAVSLDSALQGAAVTGMKLDVEGHELASLEGASRTIIDFSPWLIIEFNTTLLASPVLADWPVHRFLSSLGYKPFIYNGPHHANEITDSFSISGYCNILFQRSV
jgi:FkbM family methyltransferase